MQEHFGPVYEVTHHVDPAVIGEFDAWLGEHIESMLELPGIVRASTYSADADEQGRPCRVTHYVFESELELEHYLANTAEAMRQSTAQRFPGQFDVQRRILHDTEIVDGQIRTAEPCLNCGTPLTGQYCGNCGQRARSRLISIWELTQEAFGDLLELDSRVWRTLIPLITSPGKLTRDYLEGRRARFMPPFRTYLVLSIFFFLIAFFDPREELGIFFEPESEATEETTGGQQEADNTREEVLSELVESGVLTAEQAGLESAEEGEEDDEGSGFNITIDGQQATTDDDCADIDVGDMPDWMATRLTPARLTAVCERIIADDGRSFAGKLLDNVPAGLFILLPLMALVLKILYPLSKRYYVEHLLFVVHFHAFVFLILTLQILFSRMATWFSLSEAVSVLAAVGVGFYILVYFYKAMRRVYEQGHTLTTLKFVVLFFSYFMGMSIILLFAALFAAFAI